MVFNVAFETFEAPGNHANFVVLPAYRGCPFRVTTDSIKPVKKTILITGSTDGIGLETAKALAAQGHHILLHGRNTAKLTEAEKTVTELSSGGSVESYLADLSLIPEVLALAKAVSEKHAEIDVLINNAGILKTADTITADGLDVRFAVNTLAPYLLCQMLMPLFDTSGRIVNLSSAAQAPVNLDALRGKVRLDDMEAYSQSKLALTMWSRTMALELEGKGPIVVAVNPGSLLASKMVKEGFGVAGKDIGIGVDILLRAALSDEFANASGRYFDNDSARFASPHADALNQHKCEEVVEAIESVLTEFR